MGTLVALSLLWVLFWGIGLPQLDLLFLGGLFVDIVAVIGLVLSAKHLSRKD